MPASPTQSNFPQLLNFGGCYQNQNGIALANSTTLTDIQPGLNATPATAFSNPAPWETGNVFMFEAFGIYGTTGAPTLLLGIYYGGVGGTALCTTGAVTTASGVTANTAWYFKAIVRVLGRASSGSTIQAQGYATNIAATAGVSSFAPATASAGNQVAINTTTTGNALSLGAQWGTSSVSNTTTCTQYYVWQIA